MNRLLSSHPLWQGGLFFIRVIVSYLILRYSFELFHIQDLLKFLKDIKFPFPVFSGYAAKIIELVGGVLLMLGLFTRIATPLLIIVMAGVIYTMNGGNPLNGETPFLFALCFAAFFFIGAGKWSLDYLLFGRNKKEKR